MGNENRPLPESRKLFDATSPDGSLRLTVWDDSQIHDFNLEGVEILGLLTVSDTTSGNIYHQERVRLSGSTIAGEQPSDDEKQRWANIFSLFADG